MNNIIKLVTSSPNDINEKGEYGKSNLFQFLNSPITIDEIQKAIKKLEGHNQAKIIKTSVLYFELLILQYDVPMSLY